MKSWPADRVERWSVARLVPYAQNARTHSDEQVRQIAAAIREWGWTNPILVDDKGVIIAGHGRVMAAHLLGLTEIPVMTAVGWSDEQKRAYVLADNQLPANASWDDALLATELADLNAAGFDLDKIGFAASSIDALLGIEEAPESAEEYETSAVADRFWITIKGPLLEQARALSRLKAAMEDLPLVSVELGTTASA